MNGAARATTALATPELSAKWPAESPDDHRTIPEYVAALDGR
jgi:hypothetical protein